jgi:sn-glycerol 3-phosphate transport system permease protein
VLILGVLAVAFPLYVTFVASTLTPSRPCRYRCDSSGDRLISSQVLTGGSTKGSKAAVSSMLFNSLVMALAIPLGKIAISIIASFAIVYFRFPLRMFFFWMIFVTLMLPVEVRIMPTFKVIADLGMLNTYAGLTIPLIASATATFLFRQFFMTVPDELAEAARVDGAGPMRFFWDC